MEKLSDRLQNIVIAFVIGFTIVFSLSSFFTLIVENSIKKGVQQVQQEAIEQGFAIYHPQTREFTWITQIKKETENE